MQYFAKPVVAISFGAFFLCAETCLHGEENMQFAREPFALPIYDWSAGAFLLAAGVLTQRAWTLTRRQYQAVAWGVMLSLLLGALISTVEDWRTPPDTIEWGISEHVITFKGVTPCLKTKDLAKTIDCYGTLGFIVDSKWPADSDQRL